MDHTIQMSLCREKPCISISPMNSGCSRVDFIIRDKLIIFETSQFNVME